MLAGTGSSATAAAPEPGLRRVLGLWQLVICGIIFIGSRPLRCRCSAWSVSRARGHVVTAVLIGLCGDDLHRLQLRTNVAGLSKRRIGLHVCWPAGKLHPLLGDPTGWSMMADYVLNPIICAIWCSKAAGNFVPEIPYAAWAVFFALLFTALNLRGIQASARTNTVVAAGLGVVLIAFLAAAARYVFGLPQVDWTRPFYDPQTFSWTTVSTGASVAVLTYIGFDAISTLSEEARHPTRDILRATVLTCVIIGVLSAVEVYAGQLVPAGLGQVP